MQGCCLKTLQLYLSQIESSTRKYANVSIPMNKCYKCNNLSASTTYSFKLWSYTAAVFQQRVLS